ncbi:GNAT family N-acetyltransferase [Prolixibacter denitrificans]|uniref:Hemolysin A n=1 Tax=Prolixibacter denitrificans TaxID=1541063 RepID=A0A2P8CIG5_9BACT|nr:GNAT family N-acetyltransferase [Prolixibacter denitrificans]PSK84761.1 putative hemolysin [Prolixibacter denitrificans]GET20926.1 hemolysin A [Prolixibacter denitrificans]
MKEIIPPVPRELIESELTEDKFQRKTNKAGNEIYIFTYHEAPNTMKEIGRLRELTFRQAGGGTGKEIDIDDYDTCENNPYKQLIVWDPVRREILGGYRYIHCKGLPRDENGEVQLATARLFRFSEKFIDEYLPHVIELGRSFVQPDYQSSKAGAKGLFALDNLWDGLGALTVDHPEIKYFFGKVTMYTHFNTEARNLILHFFETYFADPDELVRPKKPMPTHRNIEALNALFEGKEYQEAYKILSQEVRNYGENIPPLINAYMNLSPSMRTFGTVVNDHFGDVEETGIMINIDEMYDAKIDRHVSTYLEELVEKGEDPKVRFQ